MRDVLLPSAVLLALTESACSIGVVLDEARHEICCLEQKNSQMEDALADLHKWLAGVQSVARKSVNSISDAPANVSAGFYLCVDLWWFAHERVSHANFSQFILYE